MGQSVCAVINRTQREHKGNGQSSDAEHTLNADFKDSGK